MTAKPSFFGAASYEAESAWAESTDTFGTRLQILGEPVVPGDIQQRLAEGITKQYANEGRLGVRGPWGGEFSIELALTGHGGATTGSLTETDLCSLLEIVLGAKYVSGAGTTVATPTSASQFSVAGGTLASGCLIRVGSIGDGRGNGQFAAVNNASTITLLQALDASPNAADVVYASQVVYADDSASSFADITSTRWLLQTANGQWKARGCFPTNISFSGLQVGEQPRVQITFGVSRWEEANETFPDATATDAKDGSIVAAGSAFLQDVGTTTRQTLALRGWTLNIDFQAQALVGPGGGDAYQTIVGAKRIRCMTSLSLTIDSEASGTNTLNDIFTGTTLQQCLMTLSAEDGKALAFFFPNCRPVNYVTQAASDGLNRRTINLEALTYTAGSSALAQSSMRLAMG